MKLGYPCINRSIGCTANSTFRLANYSEARLIRAVNNNLECLYRILHYNVDRDLFFFRISSDLIPFGSHPVCTFDWVKYFQETFKEIGKFIKRHNMRISMHPDQFVLINSPDKNIVKRSIRELAYHGRLLDAFKLDRSAKVQIHVGGVYEDKEAAMERFAARYKKLPRMIKKRLAIENDDYLYSLQDCLKLHQRLKIPVIFDVFHHACNNHGEGIREAIELAGKTWKKSDGLLMMDYSSQKKGARKGTHTEHINLKNFENFVRQSKGLEFDLMLEIKDKEQSALKAIEVVKKLG